MRRQFVSRRARPKTVRLDASVLARVPISELARHFLDLQHEDRGDDGVHDHARAARNREPNPARATKSNPPKVTRECYPVEPTY